MVLVRRELSYIVNFNFKRYFRAIEVNDNKFEAEGQEAVNN